MAGKTLNFIFVAKILPLVGKKNCYAMLNWFLVSELLKYILQITFSELCSWTQIVILNRYFEKILLLWSELFSTLNCKGRIKLVQSMSAFSYGNIFPIGCNTLILSAHLESWHFNQYSSWQLPQLINSFSSSAASLLSSSRSIFSRHM